MNRSVQDIRTLLGPLNPEPEPTPEFDQRTRTTAHRSPAPISRRTVLVGSVATIIIGASVTRLPGYGTQQQVALLATPVPLEVTPVSGAPSITTLIDQWAEAAESTPGPAVPLPATEHLQLSSWYLDTSVADQSAVSQLRARRRESWRRPDGSWTVITDESSEVFPPGARAVNWPDRPPVSDSTALDNWLNAIHPMSRGDKGVLTLSALNDLLRERVLLPAERAAVLRLIGTIPSIRYAGTTIDRLGRPGEALVLDTGRPALPARHTLVVEPASGRILAYEEMLTEDPGALNVSIPAVLKYETYVVSEFQ